MNGVQSNLSLYKETNFNWVHSTLLKDRIDAKNYKVEYLELQRKIISQTYIRLRDVIEDIKNGFEVNRSYSDVGLKFLTVKDLKEFEINYSDIKKIDLHFRDIPEKGRLKEGDIIITRSGSIGIAKTITNNDEDIVISSDIIKLRVNNKIDRDYLTTYLNSDTGRKLIEQLSYGAVMKKIGQEELLDLLIPIPSPEIQKYIGDKVRKAEELREEAKTLQKEIDILLEVDMLLKEETDKVYNIYDSKINWTNEINIEDRIDPNFYQKKYISTIEKLGNNKVRLEKYVRITKIRYQTGNINKYIEISSINNSFGTIDEVEELRPEEIPTSAKYQVKEGDILVSLVRPTRKAISIVTKEYDNAICTGGFAVLQSKGKVPVEFLTAVLRTNFVGIQFERYCAGSTYPTINEDDVVKVFIPMYSENQINKITENYRRIIDNIYTSKKLIEEAKQDVEDLIEGNFDMSKVKANS